MPERALLSLLALIVPRHRRADWLREWRGEMSATSRALRLRRLPDAIEDATRMRLRHSLSLRSRVVSLGHDVAWATRSLARNPAFALTCAGILAVAIAAATLTFTVVDAVLLDPLPYDEPDRVVILWADGSARGIGLRVGQPPSDILAWRSEARSFEDLAASRNASYGLTELEEPLSPLTHEVTTNYFDVLGVKAALGRTFESGDADTRAVLISHALWRGHLGGAPDIVGSTLVLDDIGYRVLGVLPPGFWASHQLPVQPQLWVPISFVGREDDRRDRRHAVYGRLRANVTIEQARQEMAALATRLEQEHPETHAGWGSSIVSVRDNAVGALEQAFRVAILGVLIVMAVACANVANMTLARTAVRRREVALRSALGAAHGRIVRQLLIESSLIAALGGLGGLGIAVATLPTLVNLLPGGGSTTVGGLASVPFLERATIDLRVVGFTFLVTAIAAVAAGLWPARQALRAELRDTLAEGGRSSAGSRATHRARRLLVAAETGLAMMLTVGALLMLQTVVAEHSVHLGYDADRVLTLRNSLRGPEFAEPNAMRQHFSDAVEALGKLPGVERAAAASFPPPEFANGAIAVRRTGRPENPETDLRVVPRVVVPGYFATLGIPLLEGRVLGPEDRTAGERTAVINRTLARRLFGSDSPLDESIDIDMRGVAQVELRDRAHHDVPVRIVGVVDDVRAAGDDPAPLPIAYFPHAQARVPIMNLMVRTEPGVRPEAVARLATDTLWSLSRSMNVYNVEALDARLGNLLWQSRFALQTLTALALVALLLGATGLYAVLSFTVAERTREMGVRMALGATRESVLRLVVRDGFRLAAVGVMAGVVGSLLSTRVIEGLLYGVGATDPYTLGAVAVLLLAVAAVASLAPALRATRVDPVDVLRAE